MFSKIYNNPQLQQYNYQGSIDYDNIFSDLQSDSYLKNFSSKNKMTTNNQQDNSVFQIRNNYQNTYQTQQGLENYFSNYLSNSNNVQQPTTHISEDPFYNKQSSIFQTRNSYNVNSPSFVPSNKNSNSPNYSHSNKSSYSANSENNYQQIGNNLESFQRVSSLDKSHYQGLNNIRNIGRMPEKLGETIMKEQVEKYVENGEDEITVQVWEENLEEEMRNISRYSERYCVIGYDCEFPGVIYQPKDFDYKDTTFSYDYLKANVDNLQVIQIGLTLSDFHGNSPMSSQNKKILSWQFNFKFDLDKQAHNLKSINLLKNAGIDFEKFSKFGINHSQFARTFLESGLAMNPNLKWITFHSMFDYGYLVKILTSHPLPSNESQFFNLFHTFFPTSFDIKYFFHNFTSIKVGGLDSISKTFKLERRGIAHQAGSDANLTLKLFFSILKTYRNQWIDQNFQQNMNGSIFGLNFSRLSKVF